MKPDTAGALFMVLAMVGFGIEDALFKAATSSVSAGAGTVVFGLTALTLSALGARHAGVEIWPHAAFRGWLLVRNIFEVCGRLFFALALAYTPLSTTSAILQAAPLVVTLGAALVLGERVGPRRWAAMAVGFAGVLMILRPGLDSFRPDAVFALLGMVGFAGRDLATRASPPHVHAAQLGVLGFAAVAVAGVVILAFEPARQAPDGRALILLLITGCIGALAYTALTRAMRTGDVSVVAPFRYSRLLVALVLAFVLFGERPDAMTLAGAALIVISGIYALWRQAKAGATAPTALDQPVTESKDRT